MEGLTIRVENGDLVIRIDAKTLAFAAIHLPQHDGQPLEVDDEDKLVRDVIGQLGKEDDDGSTVVTTMLDRAIIDAWEDGSDAFVEEDEKHRFSTEKENDQ